MTIPLIDVGVKEPGLRQKINKALSQVIDDASFIGGREVDLFAKEFAEYCGGGFCAPVANGTDALVLTLKALDIKPGDEIITVPFTFIATTEAISLAKATIKFVDIDPKTYCLNYRDLERALTSRTRAIIPVHLFGQPADMDPICTFAKRHNLLVIEDAAQAHGAEYKGKRVGLWGDAACFSFYPTKNLGAFGDGGAVVSNSPKLIEKIRQLSNHGQTERYCHLMEGTNSRLDGLQAAILRIKLRELDKWNARRREIAETYNKSLMTNSYLTSPFIANYAKHVFHLYCVETSFRDGLVRDLNDHKIGNGIYYPLPLHLQPAYAYLNRKEGDFPISERLSKRIISLPMHPFLSDLELKQITEALQRFLPIPDGTT